MSTIKLVSSLMIAVALSACGSDADVTAPSSEPTVSVLGSAPGSSSTSIGNATTTTEASGTPTGATATTGATAATGATGSSASTTTAKSSASKPASTTTTTMVEKLPDGTYFVFITEISLKNKTLTIDLAELYTGQKAKEAAAADGEQIETDFYIRNKNTKLRTVGIVDNASIKVLGDGSDLVAGDLAKLSTHVDTKSELPASITVTKGAITSVDEQYFP